MGTSKPHAYSCNIFVNIPRYATRLFDSHVLRCTEVFHLECENLTYYSIMNLASSDSCLYLQTMSQGQDQYSSEGELPKKLRADFALPTMIKSFNGLTSLIFPREQSYRSTQSDRLHVSLHQHLHLFPRIKSQIHEIPRTCTKKGTFNNI